jgi:CDP-diacylglycerol--glycerol-3-phosphate 3-phosphatidyltransferase
MRVLCVSDRDHVPGGGLAVEEDVYLRTTGAEKSGCGPSNGYPARCRQWRTRDRQGAIMQRDSRLNLPNVVSAYRLTVVPVILWAIFSGHRNAFFTLICVSLVTDILDGWIARHLHLETAFGARLDSLADDVTYFTAFLGLAVLEQEFIWTHRLAFGLLLLSKLVPLGVSLARFGRPTSLHLYSSKATGYVHGFFIFGYCVAGYSAWYFYFTISFSVLAAVEKLLVLLVIPELQSNLRGLYWILADIRPRVS